MSERIVCPGQLYRHFKGKLYQIVTIAIHSETGEKLVIYQRLYDDYKVYARPYEMFISEVDHIKYPDVAQKYRFQLVNDIVRQDNEDNQEDNINIDDDELVDVNKHLVEFLDADTFEEKKRILVSIKNEITDRLIDDMAASIDVTVEAGDIDNRYHSLMNCINTRARYEVDRLR